MTTVSFLGRAAKFNKGRGSDKFRYYNVKPYRIMLYFLAFTVAKNKGLSLFFAHFATVETSRTRRTD